MRNIFIFIVATTASVLQGPSSCSNGRKCIMISNCPEMLALMNKPGRTGEDNSTLQKAACGSDGQTSKVCCREACYTPDGEPGRCVGIDSCEHLARLLQAPVSKANAQYVQWSKCIGTEEHSVCCGPPKNTTDVEVGDCQNRLSAFPPDPRSECCGIDISTSSRIIGGVATAIDQYPWLAIIEYEMDNLIQHLCGGSLISNRYVLTAAHCVTGKILKSGKPINVRLGEYDTSNDGPDCVPVAGGGNDCTDPAVIVPIEKTIPHPDYESRKNDIALIRIAKMAGFTDFIRPICLPSSDVTSAPPLKFRLYVAGWGDVNENVTSRSTVKLHVDLPFVSREKCQSQYNLPKRRATLWEKQLCAGGEKSRDSCRGDSGGPLMYEKGTFEVIGIVSFGHMQCGIENIPGVYTKVFEYDTWIRTTIRP